MVAEFRQLLEDGDIDGLIRAWRYVAPHLPQPANREQAEITMHMARTEAELLTKAARLYSHRWLTERMLPSKLPLEMHLTIADAVGISVGFRNEYMRPAAVEVRGAMEDAVNECYADGRMQVPFVRARMAEARDKTMRALFGPLGG